MTPEEKAKQLIDKFMFSPVFFTTIDGEKRNARQCAMHCCEEVIAEIEDLQQNCVMEFPMALAYWQQVKEEIQKL